MLSLARLLTRPKREEQNLREGFLLKTGWDLALCCSACTWTNVSMGNKIRRKYKRLKITAYMCNWSEFWTRYKNPA